MTVSIILAKSENGVIGRKNALPWTLPADLSRFKMLTTGNVVIMGRKTFESIGKPLPDRKNIVLSRNERFRPQGVEVINSLAKALEIPDSDLFVIGGADVFQQAIAHADRIFMTLVHTTVEGDSFFPELDPTEWKIVDSVRWEADLDHVYPYSFLNFERV